MKLSFESMQVMKTMAEIGNPNSVTDAGVGALAARSAVLGAFLNVKINASGFSDKAYVENVLKVGNEIKSNTLLLEREILEIVENKI